MSSSPKTFQDAESVYDRATKLEFAADFTSAFALYLEATGAFLRLSRSTSASPAFQAQCKANARKAIERAEKLKRASKTPGNHVGVVSVPIDPFGADHQAYVLRQSSRINDIRYPLWNEHVPSPSNPDVLYSDPDGQPASPPSKRGSTVITWKRLSCDPFTSHEDPSMLISADIDQNIVDDCSVCASVAVCVQHNQRFNSRLLSTSLIPGNQPGRYDLKAYINGDCRRICESWLNRYRCVTLTFIVCTTPIGVLNLTWLEMEAIDDLLPFDNSGRPMGISSGRKEVAWPALIEKAYMKLMGGYDFPGSNSSIDIRVLTGWIPEHIELQSISFERERTWERIAKGFQHGHCVLTVGTDIKTILKIAGVKLLPSHDYAVIDIRETDHERWLTLIDSRISVASSSVHPEYETNPSASNQRMLDMRWDDICATFEGIYVSWNPGLFQVGPVLHGIWRSVTAHDKVKASQHHLRLLYECQHFPHKGGDPMDMQRDIWILLTRHYSDTRKEEEYISLIVHPQDEEYWKDIWVDTEVKGRYTTSPHVMVKTRIGDKALPVSHTTSSAPPPSTKVTGALSILAGYEGSFDDVFFTLNVFCGADIKVWWDEHAGNFFGLQSGGFSAQVSATLTTKNAGGNHTHPTYMLNPQWHLHIYEDNANSSGKGDLRSNEVASTPSMSVGSSKMACTGRSSRTGQKSVVMLSVQGPREVPLNVTAVWSSGKRIVELVQKDIAASSGAYTYSRARAAAEMAPGDYTVILSALEPQTHLGQFTLKVESSLQFDLEPIPQEGAGMYARISKGTWDEQTAAGGPSHGRYHLNPIYEVRLPSGAKLIARLQLTSRASVAPLNLSLFSASSEMPTLDQPLASSGAYSDALSGVCIPARMLSPGRYWLVPSTFSSGVHGTFRLVVYCSDAGCVVSRWTS